jgi:DNA mismatch repair protein MutS
MVETAAILNQATERSLVILDEIGRGTATFDGLSIAFACVEHLNAVNRSRILFATHFHELTQLSETTPRLFNLTMKVREYRGQLVFLHEVAPGAADRSYGIQVARLAGLPAPVIKRARAVLADLEASQTTGAALGAPAALPLFAHGFEPAPEPEPEGASDVLRDALALVDPDAMSPRDALAALYELKRLI